MGKMHLGVAAIAAALYAFRVVQKENMDVMKDDAAEFLLNPNQLIVPGLLLLALFMWMNNGPSDAPGNMYMSQWWMTLQHVVLGGAVVVAGVQLAGEMGAEEWIGKTFKIKSFEDKQQ